MQVESDTLSFHATFDNLLGHKNIPADFYLFDKKGERHCLIRISLPENLNMEAYFDHLLPQEEHESTQMLDIYIDHLDFTKEKIQVFSSYDYTAGFPENFPDDWKISNLEATDIKKGINAAVELSFHEDAIGFFNGLFPKLFSDGPTAHSLVYSQEERLRYQFSHVCNSKLDIPHVPVNLSLHRLGFDFPLNDQGEWYPAVFFDGKVFLGKRKESFSFKAFFDIYHETLVLDCTHFPTLKDFLKDCKIDLDDHFPKSFNDFLSVELSEFKLGIDLSTKTIAVVSLALTLEKPLHLIAGISLTPTFELDVVAPFDKKQRTTDGLFTGHWELGGKKIDTSISFPSLDITASLAEGETLDTDKLTKWLKEHSEIPEELLPSVKFSQLSLSGNIREGLYAFELEAEPETTWDINPLKTGHPLEIENIQFQMCLKGKEKSFYLSAVLKIDTVHIFLSAEYEAGDGFHFEGSTGPGEVISVGDMLAKIATKMGAGDHHSLPDSIHSLTMRNLQVKFDTKGNFEFSIHTMMEIEGEEQSLYVLLKKASTETETTETIEKGKKTKTTEWELVGSLYLSIGIELDIEFKKAGANKTIIGALTPAHPLNIDSSTLIKKLAPGLASSVPFDVSIALKGLLYVRQVDSPVQKVKKDKGKKKEKKEQKSEYLFRLLFNMHVGLDGIPLIGSMLPKGMGFTDVQLLAANNDWKDESITGVNDLLNEIPSPPPAISQGGENATGPIVQKGLSLSGAFKISEQLQFPMFIHLVGKKPEETKSEKKKSGGQDKTESKTPTIQPQKASSSASSKPDQKSQQHVGKKLGPVNIKKVALVLKDRRLGLKMTAGLALAAFEFDLIGLEITAPQTVLNDPIGALDDIQFDLDGFAADIHKGNLSIAGAFLRKHYPAIAAKDGKDGHAKYDEYDGLIQVAFPPFTLTGMGSYAMFEGEPSLFLFVALGFPLTVNPSLIITGMSLGFGIHRDFILPKIDQILQYPLVQASVAPPPSMDIEEMVASMHEYFPPAVDQFFVVAGIKFKALGIVDTLAILAVKFGRQMEIDLLGVSSILYGATFLEMEWQAKIVPDEGYFFMGGELTNRSFVMMPSAKLTGGFAVAFWTKHNHKGDFVISIGGYHPHFPVPAHYPDHISRLGINFQMGSNLTIKGGAYFAITPQALMLGGFLEATLHMGIVTGYMKMTVDVLIWYQPFHYDAMIGVDVGVKVDIPLVFFTLHINMHLHIDVHIWGPDFAGKAYLDVGVKTFTVPFGNASGAKAIPVGWEDFKQKFLQLKDQDGKLKDNVCSVAVTEGLIRKVKKEDKEIYVVNPKEMVIEANTTMPFTQLDGSDVDEKDNYYLPGITPMGIKEGGYTADFSLLVDPKDGQKDTVNKIPLISKVPAAIWGKDGLVAIKKPKADGILIDKALSGILITPHDVESKESHEMDKKKLAYNTDKFPLLGEVFLQFTKKEDDDSFALQKPVSAFTEFTGLKEISVHVTKENLLQKPILVNFKIEQHA